MQCFQQATSFSKLPWNFVKAKAERKQVLQLRFKAVESWTLSVWCETAWQRKGGRKWQKTNGMQREKPKYCKSQILLSDCTSGSSFGRMNNFFFFLELRGFFPSFPLFLHLCTAFGITEKTKLITKKVRELVSIILFLTVRTQSVNYKIWLYLSALY